MPIDLISRTIGGIVDQKFVLHNDLIARQMSIGTSWTQLRLGMRALVNLNGLDSFIPRFYIGFSSGITAVAGDQTPTNFFGFSFKQGITWNASTPGQLAQLGGSCITPTKIVNGTETIGTAQGSFFFSSDTTVRNILILEVTKGSPDYTFKFFHPNSSTGATTDTLLTDLTSDIITSTPIRLGYTFDSTTLTFDEVAGGLNSANIYWNLDSRYLEVSELIYVKMA